MSELKYQLMLNKDMSWVPCYLKSEADKFIADLEESHKMEVEQLLIEIAELKETLNNSRNARKYWRKEYLIEYKECSYQKYKRCLDNAWFCRKLSKECALVAYTHRGWTIERHFDNIADLYRKWHVRWLAIAEKFKEAK